MKDIVKKNDGIILISILLIASVLIMISTVSLSTVIKDYKFKKLNSEVKKVMYYAEGGLDEAYLITIDYLTSVLDYISVNSCENPSEMFKDILRGYLEINGSKKSLKSVLEDKDNYIIYTKDNLSIKVILDSKEDFFNYKIISCFRNGNIKKEVSLSGKIYLPKENQVLKDVTAESLIADNFWSIDY